MRICLLFEIQLSIMKPQIHACVKSCTKIELFLNFEINIQGGHWENYIGKWLAHCLPWKLIVCFINECIDSTFDFQETHPTPTTCSINISQLVMCERVCRVWFFFAENYYFKNISVWCLSLSKHFFITFVGFVCVCVLFDNVGSCDFFSVI